METKNKNKIGATQYIALGFLIIILVGTFLLKLPISHIGRLSTFDALFVSTSATCVTGLSTVIVADTFTTFGQFVIMCLIQVGGLRIHVNHCFNIDDIREKNYTEKSNFNWTGGKQQ
ncbi:MAG: hypothetical protein IJ220_05490 [Clostridia bacterium]|nr:hypothetical protein [Clostridia bacterium]